MLLHRTSSVFGLLVLLPLGCDPSSTSPRHEGGELATDPGTTGATDDDAHATSGVTRWDDDGPADTLDDSMEPEDGDEPTDTDAHETSRPSDDDDDGPADEGAPDEDDTSCMGQCRAPAPPGWQGPHAISERPGDHDAAQCGIGGFGTVVRHAWRDLIGTAPAECSCSCSGPANARCDGSVMIRWNYIHNAAPTCNPQTLNAFIIDNTLSPPIQPQITAGGIKGFHRTNLSNEFLSGPCTPTPSQTTPPAGFARTISLCDRDTSPAPAGACEAENICMPEVSPDEGRMCIWTEGVSSCPADTEYTERVVISEGFEDTRSCTTCACGEPQGACNTPPTLRLLHPVLQNGPTLPAAPGCHVVGPTELPVDRIQRSNAAPTSASCEPSPVFANGWVQPTDPLTLCCAP